MKKEKPKSQIKTKQKHVENNAIVEYQVGIKSSSVTAEPQVIQHHLSQINEKSF